MSSIYDWSTTEANNGNSDSGINWQEGQLPSTVNNSARYMMRRGKELLNDIGFVATTGGTANTITLTASSPFTAYADGMFVTFRAALDNTGAATLNVNSIGAKNIYKQSLTGDPALVGGEIQAGALYRLVYVAALNSAAGGWLIVEASKENAGRGHIYGLTLANNASDSTNDIDIAAGDCASDSGSPILMVLSSTLTKRLDAAWAVGSGNGGLDTGSVANVKYYVWLIQRSDTGVVDALFSASGTSPTMPTNYDRKALIGSFGRSGGINYATRSYSQTEPTPWVAYTPTFVGFTGSSVQMFSRRVGDTLEVDGLFAINSVPTATPMAFTLGFNGVDARAQIDGGKLTSSRHVGTAVRDVAVAGAFYLLGTANTNFLRFSLVNSTNGGLTVQNADAITLSGQIWSVQARVPIFGW